MRITFTNDWRYLFSKWAVGGRFANFTFLHIGWFRPKISDLSVDGLSITILGLGIRIGRR